MFLFKMAIIDLSFPTQSHYQLRLKHTYLLLSFLFILMQKDILNLRKKYMTLTLVDLVLEKIHIIKLIS
jgi:hypothetical protein